MHQCVYLLLHLHRLIATRVCVVPLRHSATARSSILAGAGNISFEDFAKALHKTGSGKGEGNSLGYAARDDSGHLSPFVFDRRQPNDEDVAIQITHCGICHSDWHQVKNEWGASNYPMVPG